MAIKIKRSTGNLAPAELAAGQLAYVEGSENGGTLYYGEIGGTVREIAGRKYVDKLNGIEAGAQINTVDSVAGKTGAVTLEAADVTDFTTAVEGLSINNVVEDTTPQLGGALDVNGNAIVSNTNGNIVLDPNGSGEVYLNSQYTGVGDPGLSGSFIFSRGTGDFTVSNSSSTLTLSAATNVNVNTGITNGAIYLNHGSSRQVLVGRSNAGGHITTQGTSDLTLSTNANTNSGTIVIFDGANGNIEITPNGFGQIKLDGASWPTALGTAGQFLQTDAAGNLSWATVDTSIDSNDVTTALGYTPENAANKGVANGYASLDANGLVPSTQLPSYVDDVLEFADLAAFPATGEAGKIYVAADTSRSYRWTGTVYAEIIASPGTTDNVTEGTFNLYYTDTRARGAISVSGDLSYNSTSGNIDYSTPPNLSFYNNDTGYITSAALTGYLQNVSEDTTPQLGGDLDVNGQAITTSVTDGNIVITNNGTGWTEVGELKVYSKTISSVDDSSYLAIQEGLTGIELASGASTSIAMYPTGVLDEGQVDIVATTLTLQGLTFPSADGTAGQVLTTDGAGNLTFEDAPASFSGSYNDLTDKPTLVTAFTGLSDTPSAFTGAAGYYVKVNSGATALEFSQDIDDGTF